jgi:cytochrome c
MILSALPSSQPVVKGWLPSAEDVRADLAAVIGKGAERPITQGCSGVSLAGAVAGVANGRLQGEGTTMLSRRTAMVTLAFGLVLAYAGTARAQQDHATPQEVVQKVRQAAQDVAHAGEAGLATFSSKNATSVWQDSYTFVLSCEGGTAVTVAHPIRPELKGKPTAQIVTFGPKPGEQIAADMCAAGGRPHGGWVAYDFPKPGETQATRKVSYLLAAPGTPYVVGAGIYDEKAKVEDLDRLAGGQR